jgi:hypothetical protein
LTRIELLHQTKLVGGEIFWLEEVAEAHTNETKPPLWSQSNPFAQEKGDDRQFFAGRRRRRWGVAARENLELTGFELEYDGTRDTLFFARCSPRKLGKFANHRLGFGQKYLALESILRRDRLRGPIRDDWGLVNSACQFLEPDTRAAEAALERGQIEAPQVGGRVDDIAEFANPLWASAFLAVRITLAT